MLQVECGAGSRSKTVLTVIALLSFLLVLPCLAVEEETRRQFMFGQRLFNEEKFTLAALQFQKFLDTFPDDPNCDKAQYYIGMSFWNLGDYERAASAFEIPLERYPESELVDESQLERNIPGEWFPVRQWSIFVSSATIVQIRMGLQTSSCRVL